MMTVNISEFRANLLKYLELVNRGEQLTVTSNGKALALIIAPTDQKAKAREHLDALAATAQIGDLTSPIDDQWESMS